MWKLVALILSFSTLISAQTPPENLYARALKACLEKEVEEYSDITSRDLYNVIVLDDYISIDDFPTQFGKIKVEYLDYDGLARKFKVRKVTKDKERREIPVIKIYPIRDKGNKLTVGYNNYWFSYAETGGFFSRKKYSYHLALEGGCNVEVGFDSSQQKFVIEKVELWGI